MSNSFFNIEKTKSTAYLLELLYSVINETQPLNPNNNTDFNYIYTLAKAHDVLNTSYYAVEKLDIHLDDELRKKWSDKRNQCFHRNMIQTAEYHALCKSFEENEVVYMPIKGLKISELYPHADYRFMSDLDFLIKDDVSKAGSVALKLGYTVKRTDFMYDDEYIKPPFMYLELHHELFGINSPFHSYYEDIFSRSKRINDFCFEMTPEDFYVYVMVHLYKHYAESGTGIRSVMDIYLLNKKIVPELNREYCDEQFKTLGLTQFVRDFSAISEKWFKNGDFGNFSEDELYILSSGNYGTTEHKVINRKKEIGEKHFYIKRIFPPLSFMQNIFHPVRKHPYLLPIFYIYRIIRLLSPKRRKKIQTELKIINKKT